MTVIKRKQQRYSVASNNSENNSDTESLQLGGSSAAASDAESVHNESGRGRPHVPPVFVFHQDEPMALKKSSGRKKLRRYQNRFLLHTLAEGVEEAAAEDALIVIMEPYRGPFARLLDDQDALDFWNVFIDKSEEEQTRIVEAFSMRAHPECAAKAERPRIPNHIRRTIKIKKDLSIEQVKQSEDHLIAFFKQTPHDIYVKYPPSYFERLLLHGMAHYHRLKSLGINENGRKRVEIFNTLQDWIPTNCFLTDFIAELRR